MPATVTRMQDRPIIVATFYAPDESGSVQEAFQQAVGLSARVDGAPFWIVDLRSTDDAFVEIAEAWMDTARAHRKDAPQGLKTVFIGLSAMSEYFYDVRLPFFREVHEALAMQLVGIPAGRV